MTDDIKRMDIAEFRRLGFLQEANRRFFHPHGLALEVVVDDDGTERLGGMWDHRDDPEGMCYGPGMIEREKALTVAAEWERHRETRLRMFGDIIQPIDETGEG